MSRIVAFALFIAMWFTAFQMVVSSFEFALSQLDTVPRAGQETQAFAAQSVEARFPSEEAWTSSAP